MGGGGLDLGEEVLEKGQADAAFAKIGVTVDFGGEVGLGVVDMDDA